MRALRALYGCPILPLQQPYGIGVVIISPPEVRTQGHTSYVDRA